MMKETMLMYARYSKRANEDVLALLDALTPEARNEDRKSYYGSLAGLAAHVAGGAFYFHRLFRASLPAAAKTLAVTEGLSIPEGKTQTEAAWAELRRSCAMADQATVDMVLALSDGDFALPVRLDWYDGKPDAVPLHFLLNQLFVHGTHHRGQISQMLDELGVEHDFSGMELELLQRSALD